MDAADAADAGAFSPAREYRAIGFISVVHTMSHLYQLALPPLFPFMVADLNMGYAQLGLLMSALFVSTAVLQTPCGFLVDRIGGRWVLGIGLVLFAGAMALVPWAAAYGWWAMAGLMVVAGIGNAVFHPADFALMASSVREERLGRAFSVHSIGGNLGTAAAPPLMIALAVLWDWRTALIAVGLVGMACALAFPLFADAVREGRSAKKRKQNGEQVAGWRFILSRPMIAFFLFYTCTSAANSGMINFSIVAIADVYGMSHAITSTLLTVFLGAGMLAVLPGGFLADWTSKHDRVLVISYLLLAAATVLVGTGWLHLWIMFGVIAIGGVARGIVAPSRDILVRQSAPMGTIGTAFAFVSTGFMVGNAIMPGVYGWLVDIGMAQGVFFVSAAFTLLGLSTIFITRERSL
ncbi:MAG: MFS transporter [Alphaproteobacteria bacterium]|nr:MFS transporter [Alphaproteobacteria bacterium]